MLLLHCWAIASASCLRRMAYYVPSASMPPTNSATAIATGLIRTGRAVHTERVGDVVRLSRRGGGYYWITFDGAEVRQGLTLLDAEPLQSTFIAAMARVGRSSK
jgi:hypothetical protein